MKRLLIWVGGSIGVLVAVLVIAVAALAVLVDPNDYRTEIAAQVQKHTGRELKIEGEIGLSFFPWLGLKMGRMELGNAEGFGPQPFARIEAADARVKILPLFAARVEMDKVVLHGLNLSLERRADGVANWDDLAGKGAPAEAPKVEQAAPPAAAPGQALAGLAVGGIEIRDAKVQWRDAQADQRVTVSDFNLTSGEISFDRPFPLDLDARVEVARPALRADIDLAADIGLDLPQQRYTLDKLKLDLDASGDPVPGGSASVALRGDLAADLKKQTLSTKGLSLQGMGVKLDASVQGEQIIDKPAFKGEIASGEFVPREVLAKLGVTLPEMADPSAMTRARLSSRFDASLDHAALQGLKLQLDKTTLSGEASVRRFTAPVIRYQLAVDEIDVDRYLPPPAEKPQQQPAKSGAPAPQQAGAAPVLPLELLRSLDVDGTFKLARVKVMNLHSDSIIATVKGQQGNFRVNPLSANLYQGGYSGDLRFDVRSDTPKLGMDEKLSGVQAGPLLKDFLGKDYVTGKANLAAKMSASGIEPMAVRKSLNGNGSFSFENGQINGVNIGELIRKAYALYKKQPAPAEEVKQTDFTELKGSFTVKNGLVDTRDLSARSPLFKVDGKGTANLVNEALDMRLETTVVSDLKNAANQTIDELKGVMVPITVKGTFGDPKFGVDVGSVLRARVEAEVEKKKEEVKEKAEERIEQEKDKLEQQLQDKLKNMLKF